MPSSGRAEMRRLLVVLTLAGLALPSLAEWRAELSTQVREHPQSALDARQHDRSASVSLLAEYFTEWDEGAQSFVFKPFLRLDSHDHKRSHVDIREAVWIRAGDSWEMRVGIDKVFWGVTEVNHLVDIINQTDLVENPDGEAKLGQPLVKLSLERDWGTLDAYLMPYFRERTFPGIEGRLRTHPRVDADQAVFDRHYPSAALRWSRSFDDIDLGLAHFHGTSRDPRFELGLDGGGNPVLVPHYDTIDQTSIDLQATLDDWLWKFEGIHRSGQGESYFAATGGFEYTLVGIADSDADLGILLEAMVDERGDSAPTPFNHDIFLGLRWVANDVDGTEVLGGVMVDWKQQTRFFNLEASRRIGAAWKASLQMRAWSGVDATDAAYMLRQDDYIEANLTRYF